MNLGSKKPKVNVSLTATGPLCRPLDSYAEILNLVSSPPAWRGLVRDLVPHSPRKVRNSQLKTNLDDICPESPQVFCHVDSGSEPPPLHDADSLPRTLICHDMANGYHDDAHVDGTQAWDSYTFYNWAGVDIFCYFSHHLVTIPPLGWINTAHAHGCKVIGTLITEWSDGIQFWEQVLATDQLIQELASALTAVAKALHFEGWLLNVENKVSRPKRLLSFVQALHSCLHAELPDAVLIWYDSVTIQGNLDWQNKLSENNRPFFEACDGLFTNYSWSPADVAASAVAAGARRHSLYVGIDVWGRNMYGGGEFNTQAAVKVAHSHGCSLAIFAPAWTHEALDGEVGSQARYRQWILRDRALWGSLWPFLNTRLPSTLPFRTGFCRGAGVMRRRHGEVISPGPWYNLRHQQYQANSAHGPHGYVLATAGQLSSASKDLKKFSSLRIKPLRSTAINTPPPSKVSLEDSSENVLSHKDSVAAKRSSISSKGGESSRSSSRVKTDEPRTGFISRICNALRSGLSKRRKATSVVSVTRSASNHSASSHSLLLMPFRLQLGMQRSKMVAAHVAEELECLEYCLEDAFMGGGCLKINPSDASAEENRLIRLMLCDFKSLSGALAVVVVTKRLPGHEGQYVTVQLQTPSRVLSLVCRPAVAGSSTLCYPLVHSSPQFQALRRHLLLQQPDFYVPIEDDYGWDVRYFLVRPEFEPVTAINVRTALQRGPILLGYFGLYEVPAELLLTTSSRLQLG